MQKTDCRSNYWGWTGIVLLLMVLISPVKAGYTWTTTVHSDPDTDPVIKSIGSQFDFWLDDISFDFTGVPDGEQWSHILRLRGWSP